MFFHSFYCILLYHIGAIDSGSGDIVIYNTGLSVPSSQDRLLLPQEAELVIAHGKTDNVLCALYCT